MWIRCWNFCKKKGYKLFFSSVSVWLRSGRRPHNQMPFPKWYSEIPACTPGARSVERLWERGVPGAIYTITVAYATTGGGCGIAYCRQLSRTNFIHTELELAFKSKRAYQIFVRGLAQRHQCPRFPWHISNVRPTERTDAGVSVLGHFFFTPSYSVFCCFREEYFFLSKSTEFVNTNSGELNSSWHARR